MATSNDAETSPDFDQRNAEALGFGSFAKQGVWKTFIPLVIGGAGAAIGYLTLGGPLRKMFPSIGKVDLITDVVSGIRNLNSENIPQIIEHMQKSGGKVWQDYIAANPGKPLGIDGVIHVVRNATDRSELEAIAKLVNVTPSKKAANLVGAAALGAPSLIAGSTFVGYDEWRKKESARLAAIELDKNIGKLELFRPSNDEIVQENNRLRSMLNAKESEQTTAPAGPAEAPAMLDAAAPQNKVHHVHHNGHVEAKLHQLGA